MKTAIITLPLHTNYGGLLQAYALKSVLEGMGHETTVLDLKDKMPAPKGVLAPLKYLARALKGEEVFREKRYKRELPVVAENTSRFVGKYIGPHMVDSYSDVDVEGYDAYVVGSDQVWRPRYFHPIEDAFLAFTGNRDVRRVAYAASFGTDVLEYEYIKLDACAKLLAGFDGVSVREDSAVRQCSEWFDYEGATHVLDPVMLLPANTYMDMASSAEARQAKGKITTYILDRSKEKSNVVEFMKKVSGMEVHDASVFPYVNDRPVGERVVPAVEDWLAAFVDAEFVVTDSFHGCVLCILMHKRFVAVGNSLRGMARLTSLMNMFGLDSRLVHGIDPEDDGEFFLSEPDWEEVDKILHDKRKESLAFLQKAMGE